MSTKTLKPREIKRLSNKELRKEYSRQRAVANKRITNLKKRGLRPPHGTDFFPVMKDLTNSEIEKQLADVGNFLRSERGTVAGESKFINNLINSIHNLGGESKAYSFIDHSNIYDFIDFMDDIRNDVSSRYFDSGDAADVFNESERLNIPENVLREHFDDFVDKMNKLEKVKPIKTEKVITYSDINRKINI